MQSGYRPYRSTTDNLVYLETLLANTLVDNKHAIAVYFDLEKAYGTANPNIIIDALIKAGIRGKILVFLNNFLRNRRISVRIQDKHSEEKLVNSGIPQGSVLSCTCFILALNQLGTNLKNVQYMIYVDDFAIVAIAKQQRTAARQLAIALKTVEQWSYKTGFKFSPQKTATMHICRVQNCPKTSPQLTLYNTELQHVTSYKYLGMIVDESLTWKEHILYTKRKAAASLNVLKAISRKDYGADRATLKKVFSALSKPIIEYASEASSSASKTNLKKLDPIQNAALRTITGAFRTSPIVSLEVETGICS